MPSLENLKKQAKALVRLHRERSHHLADVAREHLPKYAGMSDREILGGAFKLADAQALLARQHGCASWAVLKAAGSPRRSPSRPRRSMPASCSPCRCCTSLTCAAPSPTTRACSASRRRKCRAIRRSSPRSGAAGPPRAPPRARPGVRRGRGRRGLAWRRPSASPVQGALRGVQGEGRAFLSAAPPVGDQLRGERLDGNLMASKARRDDLKRPRRAAGHLHQRRR